MTINAVQLLKWRKPSIQLESPQQVNNSLNTNAISTTVVIADIPSTSEAKEKEKSLTPEPKVSKSPARKHSSRRKSKPPATNRLPTIPSVSTMSASVGESIEVVESAVGTEDVDDSVEYFDALSISQGLAQGLTQEHSPVAGAISKEKPRRNIPAPAHVSTGDHVSKSKGEHVNRLGAATATTASSSSLCAGGGPNGGGGGGGARGPGGEQQVTITLNIPVFLGSLDGKGSLASLLQQNQQLILDQIAQQCGNASLASNQSRSDARAPTTEQRSPSKPSATSMKKKAPNDNRNMQPSTNSPKSHSFARPSAQQHRNDWQVSPSAWKKSHEHGKPSPTNDSSSFGQSNRKFPINQSYKTSSQSLQSQENYSYSNNTQEIHSQSYGNFGHTNFPSSTSSPMAHNRSVQQYSSQERQSDHTGRKATDFADLGESLSNMFTAKDQTSLPVGDRFTAMTTGRSIRPERVHPYGQASGRRLGRKFSFGTSASFGTGTASGQSSRPQSPSASTSADAEADSEGSAPPGLTLEGDGASACATPSVSAGAPVGDTRAVGGVRRVEQVESRSHSIATHFNASHSNASRSNASRSIAISNASIGNAPTGNAPIGNAPIGNAPTGNAPIGNASIGNASIGNASIGNAPTGNARVDAGKTASAHQLGAPARTSKLTSPRAVVRGDTPASQAHASEPSKVANAKGPSLNPPIGTSESEKRARSIPWPKRPKGLLASLSPFPNFNCYFLEGIPFKVF